MSGSVKPSGRPLAAKAASHGSTAQARSDLLHRWSLRLEDAEETVTPDGSRKVALAAGIAGIAFTVVYAITWAVLVQVPTGTATDEEIVAYYAAGQNRVMALAAMLVMPFAGILFLYFMIMLRSAARATGVRVSHVLGTVQFAAGILFVAMLFVATAGIITTPASVHLSGATTDPVTARMLPTLSMAVLLMFGMRMAAMFVFVTSSIGRASGLIPRWFNLAGYVVGVLLLLAFTMEAWFALLFAAWVFVLSSHIVWSHLRTPAHA